MGLMSLERKVLPSNRRRATVAELMDGHRLVPLDEKSFKSLEEWCEKNMHWGQTYSQAIQRLLQIAEGRKRRQ